MSTNDFPDDEWQHVIQLPEEGIIQRISGAISRQAKAIRIALDTGLFGTVAACDVGVWLSNGEPAIIIPVIVFGVVVGTLGLLTAPKLSSGSKAFWIICFILFSVFDGGFIYSHTHPGLKVHQTATAAVNPPRRATPISRPAPPQLAIPTLIPTPHAKHVVRAALTINGPIPKSPLPNSPQAVAQSQRDFMTHLRELWIESNDNVSNTIVDKQAWPPEKWLNKMLGTYDRDWRVHTIGADFTVENYPVAALHDTGPVYDHGVGVLRITEAQRLLFVRALMPPSFPQRVTVYVAHTPDPEEDKFQQQLTTLIPPDSGWNVAIESGPAADKLAEDHQGVVVFVGNPEIIGDDEQKIIAALSAARLKPTPEDNPDTKGGWVGILVGRDQMYEITKRLQKGDF